MILEVSGREYPSLLQMLGMMTNTEEFSLKVASSLVASVNRWLHDIGDDPEHPRRKQFDEVVFSFFERVKHDQQFHDKINQWKMQLLESAEAEQYISGFWLQMKQWLKSDLLRDDSSLRQKMIHGARNFGGFLDQHPALLESVNQHMAEAAKIMAGQLRETIASHISTTVKQWNDRELIEELELSVGSDLQYIRINGTLVGGLIGLILHAIVTLFS